MHANARTLHRFYDAFGQRDAAAMARCYAPDAQFNDPVFDLQGAAIGAMWHMLCSQAQSLRIEATGIDADERTGRAHWQAWYPFSATGRAVHNEIDAAFEFRNGLIVRHRDRFDFWRWSRQALGLPGLALGWTPLLRRQVRARAARSLSAFEQRGASRGDRAE